MSACNQSPAVIRGEISAFYNGCQSDAVSNEIGEIIRDNETDIVLLRKLLGDSESMLKKFWKESEGPRFSASGSYIVDTEDTPGPPEIDYTADRDTLPVDFIKVEGNKKKIQFLPDADVPTETLFLLLKAMENGDG